MELTKPTYVITKETAEKVLKALDLHRSHGVAGDEYNDDEVIEAAEALEGELERCERGL